jgi:hypothetical protein
MKQFVAVVAVGSVLLGVLAVLGHGASVSAGGLFLK